jgi:hypothetical protein
MDFQKLWKMRANDLHPVRYDVIESDDGVTIYDTTNEDAWIWSDRVVPIAWST